MHRYFLMQVKKTLIILFVLIPFLSNAKKHIVLKNGPKSKIHGKWYAKSYTNNWRIMHYKPKQFYSIEFFDSTFVLKTVANSNSDTSTITGKWHFIRNIYGYRNDYGITMNISTYSRGSDSTIISCISCFLFNGLHTDIWDIRKIKNKRLFVLPILTALEGQFSKPYKFKFKKVQ